MKANANDKRKYLLMARVARVASKYYYCRAESLLDDATFDRLMDKLEEMEAIFPELATEDSPTRTVGAPIEEGAGVNHPVPQLSLNRAKSIEEVEQFMIANDTALVVEEKIDGLTAVIRYERGELKTISTRGDGHVGTDVTANAHAIIALPQSLPAKISVSLRAEVYCTYANLRMLNARREALNQPPYATCCSAASSTLMTGNPPKDVLNFKIIGHAFPGELGLNPKTHFEFKQLCRHWGLPTVEGALVSDIGKLRQATAFIDLCRESKDYPTDGVVFKVDSYEKRAELGETSRCPKWAYSFKEKVFNRETEGAK